MAIAEAAGAESRVFELRDPYSGPMIDALIDWTSLYVLPEERNLGVKSTAQKYFEAGDTIARELCKQGRSDESNRFYHFVQAVRDYYSPPSRGTQDYIDYSNALNRVDSSRPQSADVGNHILRALALSYARISQSNPWDALSRDFGLKNMGEFGKVRWIEDMCIRFITGAGRIGDTDDDSSDRTYRKPAFEF